MNNEPVAWIARGDNTSVFFDLDCALSIDDNPTPLYTHPEKELHLSLQKSKETGELLAVTYTDDEHRIVEVLWQKPPATALTDEEISYFTHRMIICSGQNPNSADINIFGLNEIVKDILRKAQEK